MPIICILADQTPKRYSAIKRRLGDITNMMLAQSLKELEAAGLVNRRQFDEMPPHVEYSLTEKGRSTIPMLTEAAKWAVAEIEAAGFAPKCTACQSSQ